MNRRRFLTAVAVTIPVTGCLGDSGGNESDSLVPTEEIVNIEDHHFEKFAISDIDVFVTIKNISDTELRVEYSISIYSTDTRLGRTTGIVSELPAGISQEDNVLITDMNEPEQVTRYIIEIDACPTGTGFCGEREPLRKEFNGEEFRTRLSGEWGG